MLGRLAVCSWSLRPTRPADLASACCQAGVRAVQLALDPLREGRWKLDETTRLCAEHGIEFVSGMMATHGEDYTTLESIRRTGGLVPDEHAERNLAAAQANARIAQELGLSLVTLHAGFVPEERGDPARARLVERLHRVADVFAAAGVRLGLETGQESAQGLVELLEDLDRSDIGVNFDPANMILYGSGEPIAALERLLPRVFQVHVKDALPAGVRGTWGSEVAAGLGAVDWQRFFDLVAAAPAPIDTVVEREAGENRVGDVARARELVERHAARHGRTSRHVGHGPCGG
jgi:sugar phosphate isomerase/epimerase